MSIFGAKAVKCNYFLDVFSVQSAACISLLCLYCVLTLNNLTYSPKYHILSPMANKAGTLVTCTVVHNNLFITLLLGFIT